ncbi:MAG: antitoxin [Asticcacaulis sp.]
MSQTAKLFMTGQSQAVRLPKAFRFDGTEVEIRRDALTGDVILRARQTDWDSFFALAAQTPVPADFLSPQERHQELAKDPFEGLGL